MHGRLLDFIKQTTTFNNPTVSVHSQRKDGEVSGSIDWIYEWEGKHPLRKSAPLPEVVISLVPENQRSLFSKLNFEDVYGFESDILELRRQLAQSLLESL